jgi:hypothetical protein
LSHEKKERQTVCYLINQYTLVGIQKEGKESERTKPDGTRAGMDEPVARPRGADKRTAGGQDEGEKV